MDAMTSFVVNVAGGILSNFATDAVKAMFGTAIKLQPSLVNEMEKASSTQDIEMIFRQAVGVIDAHAGTGNISIDSSLLTAMRGIRFDHAKGTVQIGNTVIKAPVLVTGGGTGSTGNTTINGGTSLQSQGTEIRVGQGAQIRITGNAQIRQT